MLRLERDGAVTRVDAPLLADHVVAEPVAGVELDARLRRENVELSAVYRLIQARREGHLVRVAVEHEVVIVAPADPKLLVVCFDAVADCARFAEVERRVRDIAQLTSRD